MSHFVEICDTHGAVLRQCRCPAIYKMTIHKSCPGPECPGMPVELDCDCGHVMSEHHDGRCTVGVCSCGVAVNPDYVTAPPWQASASTSASITMPSATEQPPPKIRDEKGPSSQDLAILGIQERKSIGLERYGTLLYPFNGRDMFRDLLEECQDAIVYAHGYMAERESAAQSLQEAVGELREAKRIADSDEPDNAIARGDMAYHVGEALIGVEWIAAWLRGEDSDVG